MPNREPSTEELRALALRALWGALGRDPAKTTNLIEFPEGLTQYLVVAELLPDDPLAQEVLEIDLADIALEVRTIWSVSSRNSAEYREAFDLGDDFYYVAYTLTEVEHGTLKSAVPKRLAEQEFAEMQSELPDAQLLTPDFEWQPTIVDGLDLKRADSLRTIASALDKPGFARHVVEKIYGAPWLTEGELVTETWEADSTKALRELWRSAVRCDPPRQRLPPGFTLLAERSGQFEMWLGRASVHWADTGKRLDGKEAEALRRTCLFLAAT